MVKAIKSIRSSSESSTFALYTCSKQVVFVGVLRGQLFVIDTHSRVEDSDGNKTACVVVFDKHPKEVEHLCSWLLKGLRAKGVEPSAMQSFSLMRLGSILIYNSQTVHRIHQFHRIDTGRSHIRLHQSQNMETNSKVYFF